MKTLRRLNSLFINFVVIFFFIINSYANEPVDIWNIEKVDNPKVSKNTSIKDDSESKNLIKNSQTQQQENLITIGQKLETESVMLAGLYDPAENGLTIDMWSNSDGYQIKQLLDRINNKKLSNYSEKILDIALLTNSYLPENNISSKEFLEFKYQYLIKKSDLDLIKKFLSKNISLENKDKIIRFYTDFYLSTAQLDKSCEIFDFVKVAKDDYLNNFKIYCLIHQNKREKAQLLFDLTSELGSISDFFKKKFNILMGYEQNDEKISEKNILYFHLSHKTNINFSFEPNLDTPKFIWTYLSATNLLKKTDLVDIENIDQVQLIEKATSEEIYKEKDLLDLYKRYKFDINQLINALETYKDLPEYKARALLYQRLLLAVDIEQKLIISSKLNELFKDSNLSNAFDSELSVILKNIDIDEVPSNFTTFYNNNKDIKKDKKLKIKFNNKIIHQSKLINYFLNKMSLKKTEKETNELLKKIKKNKKYFVSSKDIMLLESLKSDGIKIHKKYDTLYEYKSILPEDINSMIVNGETGLLLLMLVDIIGEDKVEDLDLDSVNFIVGIMNEMKIIDLRNELLLKVLPLKV